MAASTYSRVWREARELAFPPHRLKSALAADPCDLRHAGISLGLSITNDPTVLAERAGNSPEIPLRRYSWALDGKDAAMNRESATYGGVQLPSLDIEGNEKPQLNWLRP